VARPRVVQVTTVHLPTDNRIQRQCRALTDAGYDVTLVATSDGAVVESSVPVAALHRPRSRRQRMLATTRQALATARDLKADAYHFHDPELMFAGAALRRGGAKVVYDVHEDYAAEMLAKDWIARPLRRVVGRGTALIERVLSRRFDLIVAATPAIGRQFPPHKTVVVQNFPQMEEFVRPSRGVEREAAVAYVGDLTTVRGVREMVEAMAHVDPGLEARLYLAGPESTPGLERDLARLPGFDRTTLMGRISRPEVGDLLARVRAGLVLFHPLPNHVNAQPNKLFEYMSAGIPVVASDFPLWRQIVGDAGCGILVDPLDPRAIAAAIEEVLSDPSAAEAMGRNGRAAVERAYNWGSEAEKLVGAYRTLLS
jgi:glycosyltransferase involved in cell wall biosynthesis